MKIIITGATGMVGEGVLLACLEDERVREVLCVNRRPIGRTHPKLKEYLVPDFLALQADDQNLAGYDACFFCAGVSSVGMKEAEYARITYDTTLHFAAAVLRQNPQMTFIYVSGRSTDSTEQGRIMWARVKGRTENALARMPFRKVYLFRPALMKAMPGQQNLPAIYRNLGWLFPVFKRIFPGSTSTLAQVGRAMVNSVVIGSDKQVLEVKDINALGNA